MTTSLSSETTQEIFLSDIVSPITPIQVEHGLDITSLMEHMLQLLDENTGLEWRSEEDGVVGIRHVGLGIRIGVYDKQIGQYRLDYVDTVDFINHLANRDGKKLGVSKVKTLVEQTEPISTEQDYLDWLGFVY